MRHSLDRTRIARITAIWLAALALTCSTGCPVVTNLPAPGKTLTQRDPELGRTYYLYVPSNYHRDRQWPLIIACHGTRPFDTATSQLNEWKGWAEKKGFLLAAPELTGVSAPPPAAPEQIRRQFEDERTILAVVSDVRASRSVDDTRILLTGWSAGGYAVLFTGLRHPDIFRALAVRQGNFDPAFVETCLPFLDRYQPILITYGNLDPLKDGALAAIRWLHAHELEPQIIERPGIHKREQEPIFAFFAECVRQRPWIRVQVRDDPANDLHVSFGVKTSLKASRILWDFGDEQRSPLPAPDHQYDRPGMYTVRVALWTQAGKAHVRSVQIQVPRVRLGARPLPASTAPAK